MRNIDELIINRGVICMLNKGCKDPIIPDRELTLTEQNYEYFSRHLLKTFENEDSRPAVFQIKENMLKDILDAMLEHRETAFIVNAGKLAKLMLKAISNEEKEPSGDLAVIEFDCKRGKYIALMKLDYTAGYTHFMDGEDESIGIGIEKKSILLPAMGQRIKHMMIYGQDESIFIYDKDPDGWFVRGFGRMEPGDDARTNLVKARRAVEVFARKAFEEDQIAAEEFRRKMNDRLRTEEVLDIKSAAEAIIEGIEKKEVFIQTMQASGLKDNRVSIDKEWAEKRMARKRLRIDRDIVLQISTDDYNDKEKFRIIKNGDGSIDIQIRNVRSLTEK